MHTNGNVRSTHTAIIQGEAGSLRIAHGLPIPQLGPGHILVRTAAVALNPSDFKMPFAFPAPGCYAGCDFAGTVCGLAPDIAANGPWMLGDRVFGAVTGNVPDEPDTGSFAEYVKAISTFTWRIPDSMSFSEAVGLGGVRISTMGLAIFKSLDLPGTFECPVEKPRDVLIYGGSTSVGTMGIQMTKLLGHNAITTCSPSNTELVKSYGADHVFDYHSPECAADIKKLTRNGLKYIIDPFAEVRTMSLCMDAMGRAGGRYCALEAFQEELHRKNSVRRELAMGASIHGFGIRLGGGYSKPPSAEMTAWAADWFKSVQRLIDDGKLTPHPVRVLAGGFDAILQGLDILKRKEVSAEKIVVKLLAQDDV